jgi:hypothetical protein
VKKVSPQEAAAAWFGCSVEEVYVIDRRNGVCAEKTVSGLCLLEPGHDGPHQPRVHTDDQGREWALKPPSH